MCYICMFRYSAIYINIVSFVISNIILLIVNLFLSNMYIFTTKGIFKISFKVNNGYIQRNSNYVEDTNTEKTIEEEVENKNDEWYLEIPCINLKANIKEGTTKDIMEDYIGHFEETKKDIGNIGLAAHNRGYKNNYFQNLKELKQNDEIYYKYKNEKRKYVVIKNIIIEDTDWTNLEESDGNIITLITCVENQPEYRSCVQGKEKIEEREAF